MIWSKLSAPIILQTETNTLPMHWDLSFTFNPPRCSYTISPPSWVIWPRFCKPLDTNRSSSSDKPPSKRQFWHFNSSDWTKLRTFFSFIFFLGRLLPLIRQWFCLCWAYSWRLCEWKKISPLSIHGSTTPILRPFGERNWHTGPRKSLHPSIGVHLSSATAIIADMLFVRRSASLPKRSAVTSVLPLIGLEGF